MSFLRTISFALVLIAGVSSAEEPRRTVDLSKDGREILRRAFNNYYDVDLTTLLTLELIPRRGRTSIRQAEIARKRIDGRLHAYGRFLAPAWMRGTGILMIDNLDRSDDHLIFMPSSERVRRVSSVQRSDAFLGSDLCYEDLERRYPDDFDVESVSQGEVLGESVFIVRALPKLDSNYSAIEVSAAAADWVMLRITFFRGESREAFKTITVPSRESVVVAEGHAIPTVLRVENAKRGTATIARFEQLRVNPDLPDRIFTSAALESGAAVPGVSGRSRRGPATAPR